MMSNRPRELHEENTQLEGFPQPLSYIEEQLHTRVLLVTGPLGSGKTSFINVLLRSAGKELGKVRVIVNDAGAENIDATRIQGADLTALSNGCVCCDDLASLCETVAAFQGIVDTVIIEPTGLAEGMDLKKRLKTIAPDVRTVALLPVEHFDAYREDPVFQRQIAAGDAVGLTWAPPSVKDISDDSLDDVLGFIAALHHGTSTQVHILPEAKAPSRESFLADQDEDAHHALLLFQQLTDDSMTTHDHCESCAPHGHHTHEHSHDGHHHHHHEAYEHKADFVTEGFLHSDLTPERLKQILQATGQPIRRAKGIVAGHQFDIVMDAFRLGEKSDRPAHMKLFMGAPLSSDVAAELFTQNATAPEEQLYKYAHTPLSWYSDKNHIEILDHAKERVDFLVGQYKDWMDLSVRIAQKNETLQQAGKEESFAISNEIRALQQEQKDLGEAMTFDDPIIWMLYKVTAYKGLPNELQTLDDLRTHSLSNPTYICGKRMRYLDAAYQKETGTSLISGDLALDGVTPLLDLLESKALYVVLSRPEFMKGWYDHEFYLDQGRVAKWENITPSV